MILNYYFEQVRCQELVHGTRSVEPHYQEVYEDMDFEYELEIRLDDVIEYMKPYGFEKWENAKKEGFIQAISNLWEEGFINVDSMEDDEYFIDFMKERYEEEAKDACWKYYND